MKNATQKFGKCIILAAAAIGLSACVIEPAPYDYYGEPVAAAPAPVAVAPAPVPYGCCYAYPVYPPYYGYGYGYYGPAVGVGIYGGGRRWR